MYRVKDPLENLLLKVSLRKTSLARRRPERGSNAHEEANERDLEVLTFHWQEKYFSPLEKKRYAEEPPSHAEYQSLLAKRERNGNARLFTYTSQDRYQPHDGESELEKKGRRSNSSRHRQTMCLMADLQPQINGLDFDEKVLFTISVDSSVGLLILSHDLSHDDGRWYRIENSRRDIFEYRIENVSQSITKEELKKERQLHNQLHSHQSERLRQCVGEEFELPPTDKNSKLIHIIGSIETAEGFGWLPVYIKFELHLPNESFQLKSGNNFISTQLSSPNSDQVTHYCTPFEYQLLHSPSSSSSSSSSSSPFISIEVSSLDSWDRHRLEGYGTYTLPLEPVSLTVPISTSKPHPSSLKEELRHYFIGSSSQNSLNDKRDTKSRFGAKGISSGKVYIKLSILNLSHETAEEYSSKEMRERLQQQQGKMSMSVKAVSDAYKRARSKALEVLKTSEEQTS